MTGNPCENRHATCLQLVSGEQTLGVMLTGPSGVGKSALALRLIDCAGTGAGVDGLLRAHLVADDQVLLSVAGGKLLARAPARISGLLEVRGAGIVKLPDAVAETELAMVLQHAPAGDVSRLPEAETIEICDIALPLHRFDFAGAHAPAQVRLLARVAWGDIPIIS